MRSTQFWLDLAERAIKTLAQTLLAWLVVDQTIWELDWQQGLGVAATATVASILGSIASAGVAEPETASLVSTGRHAAAER
ncbi:hypothetical protein CKALI_11225 [Corynebacterium kalinowskii]|uniref:Holin n=1 Tax=Corynebacterium kalinowskii TaxID=2675216 RepID=A0A6B8VJ74_9CORY|nr:holin [Corynebacterium kalinowskii]QGU03089.1 hypothetical protein CKALI_11225 [Corynebacterium kalinowskii]